MPRDARFFVAPFALLALAGCTSAGTGQPEVSFDATFVPTGTNAFVVGDVAVALDEAKIAFGPAYFCASASGSATLCEAALGEIRRVTTIDARSAEPVPLGTYEGFAGTVRSASFDYGIHWFLPEQEAHPAPEAPSGHSAHFTGTATRAGTSVRFEADVDVVPLFQGQRAVPTTKAAGEVSEDTTRLEVRFDLASLFSDVDFDAMLAAGSNPPPIEPGTRDHDAIVIRMVSSSPPTFSFVP